MPDANGKRHAVILSGGGASGAYEVGVLKGLFTGHSPATNYAPLIPDVFAGTSIGAYNASLLVAEIDTRGPGAIDYLEDIWLDCLPQDDATGHNFIMRYRADPFEYFDPAFVFKNPLQGSLQVADDLAFFAQDLFNRGSVFFQSWDDIETRVLKLFDLSILVSNDPQRRLIQETINFDSICRSSKVLKIATTNWSTGQLRIFDNEQLDTEQGPKAILASTAIPGIFPQVEIEGEYYADGGVVMNTPLHLGIEAGADILHVIYLDPDVRAIPLLPVRNAIDTFSRLFAIQFAATVNRDIAVAKQINEGLDVIEKVAGSGSVSGKDVRAFILVAKRLHNIADYSKYKKITIHRYQPRDTLKGVLGLLNFSRNKSATLIQQGLDDATSHNCKASECILAGA
ncbi:MAG TPA: patatin-like phospholipase family protein [Pyrinomonadaceae bacterium]|nr:patatin-like phospholipase family protein [Pyrinomonadaceae bacterium]